MSQSSLPDRCLSINGINDRETEHALTQGLSKIGHDPYIEKRPSFYLYTQDLENMKTIGRQSNNYSEIPKKLLLSTRINGTYMYIVRVANFNKT